MPNPRPNILLVEDNPGDVRLFQEALAQRGGTADLSVVQNGEDALRVLRQESPFAAAVRPSLVVLDLNLPRKDGRQVLAEMKADPNCAAFPW